MAGVKDSSCSRVSAKPCKKCKVKPLEGVMCVKCNSLNHPGCVKYMRNVKTVDKNTIICCFTEETKEGSDLEGSFHSVDETVIEAETIDKFKLENVYLKKLLKNDEIVIKSLNEVITSLKNQIVLLNKINNQINTMVPSDSEVIYPEQQQITHALDNEHQNQSSLENRQMAEAQKNKLDRNKTRNCKQKEISRISSNNKEATNENNTGTIGSRKPLTSSEIISASQLSTAVNLAQETIRKTNNKVIIGSNMSDNVSAKKLSWFSARKYILSYTKTQLESSLNVKFPGEEFFIEEMQESKYFKSFKIGIEEHMIEKFENPNNWPSGIEVSKFFRRNQRKSYDSSNRKQLGFNRFPNRWRGSPRY